MPLSADNKRLNKAEGANTNTLFQTWTMPVTRSSGEGYTVIHDKQDTLATASCLYDIDTAEGETITLNACLATQP